MKLALRNDIFYVLLLFIGAAAFCIFGAWALGWLYHLAFAPHIVDVGVFLRDYKTQIHPEPDERFIFIVLGSAVPTLCLGATIAWLRTAVRIPDPKIGCRSLLASFIAVLFIIPLSNFEFTTWLINKEHVAHWHTALLLSLCMLSWVWYWITIHRWPRAVSSLVLSVELAIFVLTALLQILAWRVVSINSVIHHAVWNVHFDAVIYTISQVVLGKTLLVDLPSQYGMFPEFVAPLFRMVGLSVLSFTVVCALMQIGSLICIWWVMRQSVRDPSMRIVASFALLMLTFETVLYLIGIPERYFQYWPIRFFWPSVSVLAFYLYSQLKTVRLAAVVSVIGALGALWNADSGVMIELAFTAFLGLKIISAYLNANTPASTRNRLWVSLVMHVLIAILIAVLFLLYLSVKSGSSPNLSWLYEYQATFYKLGFTMLRMPTYPSAWMTVIAVYLMGFIVSFVGLARGRQSWRLDNLLFISALGLGLFVYYQGRSHILNLITVAWPAVIVGAMLADRILRGVRANTLGKELIVLPAAALGILAFCASPFLWSLPVMLNDSISLFDSRNQADSAVVHNELKFIKEHSRPGEECAILSVRQGIYYAEAKIVSPFSGPGYVETVLEKDRRSMLSQLERKRPTCVFLGLGESSQDLGPEATNILKGYTVIATNQSGTTQYLTP